MYQSPQGDAIANEFRRERSTRRAISILEAKRKRIREDINQLVNHLTLIAPPSGWAGEDSDGYRELLTEALGRLGDDTFSELVLQALERY